MERIPLSGLITPVYTTDNYPIIDPRFGIDGFRSLDSLTDMYNLPLEKRRAGMVVGIPNTSSNMTAYYTLKTEGNGVTWSVGDTSNWYGFLTSVTGSNAVPVKYNITNETITVPLNYEYLIWGNMTVGQSGSFVNDGKTYVINGTIATASDGATSGSGGFYYIQTPTKYTETFSSNPTGVTISHNLNTEDIVYSVKDYQNFVVANVEIIDSNSILVKTLNNIASARITIIG